MKARCTNKNNKIFPRYGGRGILLCNEWHSFVLFYEWAINNGYSDKLSIERKDVNGNYEPENCMWATCKQQQNNRRNNHRITVNGETRTASGWATLCGIHQSAINQAIKGGNDAGTYIANKLLTKDLPKGAKNKPAKLSTKEVAEIKHDIASGELHREIAKRYGITKSHVSQIATGRLWKQI